jgi:hypothetical protein
MPDRKVQVDVSDALARARRLAGGEHGSHGVVVIRPDHSSLLLPSPADSPEVSANCRSPQPNPERVGRFWAMFGVRVSEMICPPGWVRVARGASSAGRRST